MRVFDGKTEFNFFHVPIFGYCYTSVADTNGKGANLKGLFQYFLHHTKILHPPPYQQGFHNVVVFGKHACIKQSTVPPSKFEKVKPSKIISN